MAKLSVFYFDDIKAEREQYEPLWTHILSLAGFDADILYESDLKDLEPKLIRRPHLVIADNSIQTENLRGNPREDANEGARFIAEHKPQHPDTVFVLYTGEDFSMLQLGRRIPNPDLLVTKDYLHNESYQKFLATELRRKVTRLPLDQVVEGGSTIGAEDHKRTLQSLIEQIVHDMRIGGRKAPWSVAKLTKVSGGFSGAAVYRLDLEGDRQGASIPTIVKIGRAAQIDREISAFGAYARWYLPHDLRVDIVGHAAAADVSAVCYAFALGGQDKVEPMSAALARGKKKAVAAVNRHLFGSQRQGWYKTVEESRHGLRAYLSNLDEYPAAKDDWRDKCFETSLQQICAREHLAFVAHDSRLVVGSHECDEIRRALRALPNCKVPLCICHGDLNANNIFITANASTIALIDFEQTGLHHVFRDFVSLESSIRSLFAAPTLASLSFERLLDLEANLLQNNEASVGADPILEQVQAIRRAAFLRFPDADRALYHGAIAMHLWKLLGFRDEGRSHWSQDGERHLASGLVAVLEAMR